MSGYVSHVSNWAIAFESLYLEIIIYRAVRQQRWKNRTQIKKLKFHFVWAVETLWNYCYNTPLSSSLRLHSVKLTRQLKTKLGREQSSFCLASIPYGQFYSVSFPYPVFFETFQIFSYCSSQVVSFKMCSSQLNCTRFRISCFIFGNSWE